MTDAVTLLLQEAAALDPAPVAPPGLRERARRRYRRHRGAAVAASALSVLLVALLAVHRPAAGPPPYAGPGTAEALAAGTWQTLADPPLRDRTREVVAWTGSRLLVWGGHATDGTVLTDGASYDPATGTWSPLPSSPLPDRGEASGVWSGSELVVLVGPTGPDVVELTAADYRPDTGTWRRLPAPPSVLVHPAVVRDGARVVAVSAQHAVALDPASGWTELPDPPFAHGGASVRLSAVATDEGVVVQSSWLEQDGAAGQEALLLDDDRWRAVPAARAPEPLLWTGRELLSPAGRPITHGGGPGIDQRGQRAYVGGSWRLLTHGPVDDLHGTSTWTGAAMVTAGTSTTTNGLEGGNGAVWEPASDRWTRLPDAPFRPEDPSQVWTGTVLLQVGRMTRPTPPDFTGLLVPQLRLLALVPEGVAPLAG